MSLTQTETCAQTIKTRQWWVLHQREHPIWLITITHCHSVFSGPVRLSAPSGERTESAAETPVTTYSGGTYYLHNCVSDKEGAIIAWHSHNQGAYRQQGIMGAWLGMVRVVIPLKMEGRWEVAAEKCARLFMHWKNFYCEQFMRSVLPGVVENSQRGMHTVDSIVLET